VKRLLHPLSYILLCVAYSSLAVALTHPGQLLWVFILALILDFREGFRALGQRLLGLRKILWLLLSVLIIQVLFRRGGGIALALPILKIHGAALVYSAQISLRIIVIYLCAASLSKLDFSLYRSAFSRIRLPEELTFMISYMAQLIPRLNARFKEQTRELRERGLSLRKIGFRQKLTVYKILALATIADLILQSGRQSIALELRGFRSAGKPSSLHRHLFHLQDLEILLWFSVNLLVLIKLPGILV